MFDPNAGNNTGSASVSTTSADLSIAKTDSPDPVAAGQSLTYTVSVVNNGPDAAGNTTVTDTLPPGVSFISAVGAGWGYATRLQGW